MPGSLRFSLRELLLLLVIVALAAAMVHQYWAEERPVYLHVFGTNVPKSHDLARPNDAPLSSDGLPWTRVATVTIYDGQPFGVFIPNDRTPALGFKGKLRRVAAGKYQGPVKFFLDDDNLTVDFLAHDAELNQLVYIDSYSCYILSESDEPYAGLKRGMQPAGK